MTPLQRQIAELLYPLADFYSTSGLQLPHVEPMAGEDVPAPYRDLLVHDRDMTSTLERFWKSPLRLRVLDKRAESDLLTRQVVLETDDGRKAVEFGAIRIQLARFAPAVRDLIIACRRPLGGILEELSVEYSCRPSAYFSFESDTIAERAFGIRHPHLLYGRHNALLDHEGEVCAEVVEILPPIEQPTDTP